MMEAEFGLTEMAMTAGSNSAPGDEHLLVKFYYKPRPDAAASAEAGRPIYKDVCYVDIRSPGNRTDWVARPARDTDKQRFPEHYRKFLAREEQEVVEGTPLAEWPGVTRGQVEEMKFFNISTVEQLANVSDSSTSNIMGMAVLKQKAQKYLDAAKDNAAAEALIKSEARVAELEAKVNALIAAQDAPVFDDEEAPKRATPRRRRKAVEE